MRMLGSFRCWALGLAMATLLSPQLAGAAQASPTRQIADVALHDGGVFVGQVVNRQGAPKVGAKVAVVQNSKVVATAQTDKQGRFLVRGLRGGVYQVQAEQSASVCRLWAPRTAPPAARPAALLVSDSNVALGQDCGGCCGPRFPCAGVALGAAAITGGTIWALDYNKSGS